MHDSISIGSVATDRVPTDKAPTDRAPVGRTPADCTGGGAPFFFLERPLESMPRARQMRIAHLGAFPDLARALGGNPRSLLEHHDIDPRAIRTPDHLIDCRAFTALLENCSSALNAPLFGLKLAQRHEPDVYGCVIALCRAAATMREAITSFVDYIRVTHSPASVQELVEGEHTAELRWFVRTDLGCNQQANYLAALLIVKLLRQIGGRDFRPSYVNLAVDARGRDIAQLEQAFACRFRGGGTINAIAFPKTALDRPVAGSSRVLFTLLRGYLDKVKAVSEVSIAEQVENYIRSTLASGRCSIDECAGRLGVAARTLQTRLNASGDEFSKILERQRIDLAKTYLSQKRLAFDEIAANLGYTEQSSFSRAFKRWTGLTPRQYRRHRPLPAARTTPAAATTPAAD